MKSVDQSVCFASCPADGQEAEEFEKLWVHDKVNNDKCQSWVVDSAIVCFPSQDRDYSSLDGCII